MQFSVHRFLLQYKEVGKTKTSHLGPVLVNFHGKTIEIIFTASFILTKNKRAPHIQVLDVVMSQPPGEPEWLQCQLRPLCGREDSWQKQEHSVIMSKHFANHKNRQVPLQSG